MNFLDRLSFQLYSARKFPPLADQFVALARLGYRQVEPYGALFADADALKASLDKSGFSAPSSHIGIDVFRSDFARVAPLARRFGVAIVVLPYLQEPDRPTDAAGWIAFGQELQGYAARLKAEGLALAWHNHDFEMVPLPSGEVPMDLILAAAPHLLWEADIGWIVRAGADALPWLQRYKDRIKTVHLKDIAPEGTAADEDGWADIGEGTIDWRRLVPALSATGAVMVVEHDNPSDWERFARRSRAAVGKW